MTTASGMSTTACGDSAPPADWFLRRAAGYLELGQLLADGDAPPPPSARAVLRRALDELGRLGEPERTAAPASLIEGETFRAAGDWSAALEPFTRAATTDGHVEAWLGLGWCRKRLGDVPGAIAALEQGLARHPRQAILFFNLACYHSLGGNVTAAVDHLARAISLDSRYRDLTAAEHDFDPIRDDPRFVAATSVTV